MGKLHEVLAVLGSVKGTAAKIAAETVGTFQSKKEHFHSLTKTYKPYAETGSGSSEVVEESTPLVTTVGEKLRHFAECFSPLIDAGYQVDCANLLATANVVVDGKEFGTMPATFLMQFDKRLTEIRQVIEAVPTLDPKQAWVDASATQGKGVFATAAPEVRKRGKKTLKFQETSPATREHPAQVEKWWEDIAVGDVVTNSWSGEVTVEQKYLMLSRLDKLQNAVKRALAEANSIEHPNGKIAQGIFDYLFAGIPLSR